MTIEPLHPIQIAGVTTEDNPAVVYLLSLSASSRVPQANALKTIANIIAPGLDFRAVPWASLRYQHTQAIRTAMSMALAPATTNRNLAALRGVLKETWRLGYIDAETFQRATDWKPVRHTHADQAERGRHIKQGEFMAIIKTCDLSTYIGQRDACMFAVAYSCGLRRNELVNLDLGDYNWDTATIRVRHGKGDKERLMPVIAGAGDALADWIEKRGDWTGPLFNRILKSDQLTHKRLTGQAFYQIIVDRCGMAGVLLFTPHDLRRTFAGDLLDAGADLSTVQKLMGHSDTKTTASYDRRDSRVKRSAVDKLHFPYRSTKI